MLFDLKIGWFYKAGLVSPVIFHFERGERHGRAEEAKITRGGGRGGLARVIPKVDNTLFRVCLVKMERKC